MNTERKSRIEVLAYKIWEEQGRPEGRQEENWAEAERRLRFESDDSSESDSPPVSDDPVAGSRKPGTLSLSGEAQDTPGRSNPTSSRQQTHPSPSTQTGPPDIDGKSTSSRRTRQR